jgi:hypothetical protein
MKGLSVPTVHRTNFVMILTATTATIVATMTQVDDGRFGANDRRVASIKVAMACLSSDRDKVARRIGAVRRVIAVPR